VDVRIVCATNRNPQAEVAAGRFPEDLYYRLAVVPLELPPLRMRGSDIELLANAFLKRFSREEGKTFQTISAEFAHSLKQYSWPGNVRELQNLIRRSAVMFEGPDLPVEALPHVVSQEAKGELAMQVAPAQEHSQSPLETRTDMLTLINCLNGLTLDEIERIAIDSAIDRAGGSLPAAARHLGVSPSTLYRKREKWMVS
jgi:two-component system repressor protein LuxO